MSNSVGNEENRLTMEGTTMKGILAVITGALLMSATAYAEQPNYGFDANDINDPIFKEKCTAYIDALANADYDTLMSFISPELKKQYPKKLPMELDKRISKLHKIVSGYPYFRVKNMKVSEKGSNFNSTQPKKSEILILATYQGSPKDMIFLDCTFEKTSDGNWMYRFVNK
ncbi:hypothetical protein L9G74_19400 [Shewanella sp. C32]|uniref:DUF3887 domain-containing protein n=1 Tax=Shewanella electrica TaxID=515560 RepID=A0ABT2FQT8_9GAMM|nr:hypothetical protein [Shewanella electrica]MCH1926987.1 hypothetical protein [Shewanella electrica]MCS4558608.1 hypothetical protein [Shewanella electrica]